MDIEIVIARLPFLSMGSPALAGSDNGKLGLTRQELLSAVRFGVDTALVGRNVLPERLGIGDNRDPRNDLGRTILDEAGKLQLEITRDDLEEAELFVKTLSHLDNLEVVKKIQLTRKQPFYVLPASHLKPGMLVPVIGRKGQIEEDTVAYFKSLSVETGIPYQNLINLYLSDCARNNRKLSFTWK